MLLFTISVAFTLLSTTPLLSLGDFHHADLQHKSIIVPKGARILPSYQLRTKRQSSWEGADSCSHAFHSYLCRRKGKVPTPPIIQERPGFESRPDVVKTRPITFAPAIPKTTTVPTTRQPPKTKPKDPFLESSLSSPNAVKPPDDPVKPTTKAPLCSGPLLSQLCPTTTQKPFKDPEFAQPTFIDPALTRPKVIEKVPLVPTKPLVLDPSQTKQVPNRKVPPLETVPAATDVQSLKNDMCSHPFHSFLCSPRGTRRRIVFTGKPHVPAPREPENSLSGDASNPFGELVDPIFRQTTTTARPTSTTLRPIRYTNTPITSTTTRPTTISTTRRPFPSTYTVRTTPKPTTIIYRPTTTTTYKPIISTTRPPKTTLRPTTTTPRPTTTARPTTTTYRPTTTTPRPTTTTYRPTTTTYRPTTTTPRPTTTTYRPTITTPRPTTLRTTTTAQPSIPFDTQEARSPFSAVQLPRDPIASGTGGSSWTGDSCKHSFHSYLCSPSKGRKNRIRFGGQMETRPRPQFIPPPVQKATSRLPTTTTTTPRPYRRPPPDPRPTPSAFGEISLPLSVTTTTTKGPCVVGDPRPECDPSLRGDASSPSQTGVKLPPPPLPPRRPPPPPVRPPPPLPPVQPPPRRPSVRPPPPIPSRPPATPPPPRQPPPVRVNTLPPVPAEFVRGPAATDLVESNALPSNSCAHAFHSHLCRSSSLRSRRKRPFGK